MINDPGGLPTDNVRGVITFESGTMDISVDSKVQHVTSLDKRMVLEEEEMNSRQA